MIACEGARFQRPQYANSADQVFIHREVVIHVELHHGDDLAELRQETAQDARFIHGAENGFGIA